MSRHKTILGTPELFRALLKLEGFDGFEIDRARLEYRWNPEKYAGSFTGEWNWPVWNQLAEELERFE